MGCPMDSDVDASEGESSRPRYGGPTEKLTEIMLVRMKVCPKPQFVKYQGKGPLDAKLLLDMSTFLADLMRLQSNVSFRQSMMVESILAACKKWGMADTWFRSREEELEWAQVMAKRVRHACRHLAQALLKPGRKPYWASAVLISAGLMEGEEGAGSSARRPAASSAAGAAAAATATPGPELAPETPLPAAMAEADSDPFPAAQDTVSVHDSEDTEVALVGPPGDQDVGPPGDQDVGPPGDQDVGPPGDQDGGPGSDQDVGPPNDQDVGPPGDQDVEPEVAPGDPGHAAANQDPDLEPNQD